jgi:two-component system response regulator NreC
MKRILGADPVGEADSFCFKMKPVRILIADDHEVVREGARMLLEREPGWEVCGIAKNGRDAVEQARQLQPDIVVLDMSMPELNGLDAARQIKRALPDTELLIFTAHESEELIQEVFDAGAKSYILKADASLHLVAAIKALSQHKPYFTNKVSETLFARFSERSANKRNGNGNRGSLTAREREIVRLLARGKSNKEVANALGLGVRTVETHRANLLRKQGIESLAGLVRYAIRNGIIEP